MKRITKLTGMLFVAAIMTFAFSSESQAVPTFARQTGFACTTCHFNSFPALNAMGRAFKASGFTQMGAQGKIEDEGLSIPDTLNASLVTKFRYQKSTTKGPAGTLVDADLEQEYGVRQSGTDKGEIQFPDEAALLIGGRAAENIGFLLEFNAGTPDGASFASFKMPITVFSTGDSHVVLIPFMTDALGAPYATEVLNTGAVRNLRSWEARKAISAQQYVLTKNAVKESTTSADAAESAEGLALAYYADLFHASATLWGPAWGHADTGLDLSQYFRAAVTPNIGGWDLAAGVQIWTGETTVGDGSHSNTGGAGSGNVYKTNAMAIDAQAQGIVGAMPLGVYASYAVAPKADLGSTKINFFNTKTTGDTTAMAVNAELGVVPNKVTVGAGLRLGDTGATTKSDDTAMMLGAKYMLAQNSQVQFNYEIYSGGANDADGKKESMMTLMLFSAF